VLPTGEMIPNPVTTTLRFVIICPRLKDLNQIHINLKSHEIIAAFHCVIQQKKDQAFSVT
jgi:hypothetical protein